VYASLSAEIKVELFVDFMYPNMLLLKCSWSNSREFSCLVINYYSGFWRLFEWSYEKAGLGIR
jgi:hypothetical protein